MDEFFDELRAIHHEIRKIHARLVEIILFPVFQKELALSALTELQALGARIDAVTAALPTDIATAVAAQAAADQTAITTAQNALSALQAQNASDAAALETEITTLTAKVAALETVAGIPQPTPAPTPTPTPTALAVSPASISSGPGAAIAVALVASGGTAPYSFASNLADVTVDASGNVAGTPAAVETGAITVTDSSTPPETADVPVTIA